MVAAGNGHTVVVQDLLGADANVEALDYQRTNDKNGTSTQHFSGMQMLHDRKKRKKQQVITGTLLLHAVAVRQPCRAKCGRRETGLTWREAVGYGWRGEGIGARGVGGKKEGGDGAAR